MATYTQILYQVVFSTKYRAKTLLKENRERLFAYMAQIIINRKCFVYAVGGIEDHVHLVFELHRSVALADVVKAVKVGSSFFIKQENLFPDFQAWQEGYGAFTYSAEAKENLIKYVQNQEQHHQKISPRSELLALLKRHQVPNKEEEVE